MQHAHHHFQKSSAGCHPSQRLTSNNEQALLAALRNGPIAAAVSAHQQFLDYTSGIFTSSTCNRPLNHAVVIVGSGTDPNTELVGIIKQRYHARNTVLQSSCCTTVLTAIFQTLKCHALNASCISY
jgi:hypothetical protein